MGDSWTSGYQEHVSYRYDLWYSLIGAGFNVDFVGSKTAPQGTPNLEWYPNYVISFDRDHEGYSGLQTNQLARYAGDAARAYQPELVLLWTGANDIWFRGDGGISNARVWLREIVFDIRSAVPEVVFLLALNPPYEGPNANLVGELNQAIRDVATELDQPQSPIILVDLNTGYSVQTMTWDGVHQNRVGEEWVAEQWFDVLAGLLPKSDFVPISGGHSGAWFNPATSGQGQFLDVVPEDQFMFLSWFTYTGETADNPGQQRWYTAQGSYTGGDADLPLYETLGGRFDDPREVETNPVGSLTIRFTGCGEGELTYAFDSDGRTGTMPLHRVVPGSANFCEQSNQASPQFIDINPGMDGGWFNPNTPGQGFFFDAHIPAEGGGFFFASWFTYGDSTASGQRWLTAQGSLEGSTADLDVFETTGGQFDDSQVVNTVKVGTMTIEFSDCNHAQLSYALDADGLSGDMEITRVVPASDAICQHLAGVQ